MSTADNNGKELLKGALDSHRAVTIKALDVIPPGSRLTVYVLWTISAFSAVVGGVFVFSKEPTYGFVVALVALGAIVLSLLLQNRPTMTSPEQLGKLVQGQVTGPSWARSVPKVPIEPPEKLDAFQLSLRQIRTAAIVKLNDVRKKAGKAEIQPDHVRINVFLVHTENMAELGELVLIIPKKLNDHMIEFKDRNIKMLPHEGVTGRTFTLGEPCGATAALEANKLNWSRVDLFPDRPSSDEWGRFSLSEEQSALIGTRLRWVMSFPLRYAGTGRDKTFAVLNIDGLDDELTIDELQTLAASTEPSVNAFAITLAALPTVRITVRVEEASA